MAMKRCPVCGEKYSDTYRDCPFCEEDELWQDEEERPSRGGYRGGRGQLNLMTPTLVVLIVLMACVLVYLLYGDKLMGRFAKDNDNTPSVDDVLPQEPTPGADDETQPAGDGGEGGTETPDGGENNGQMPEDPTGGASGGAGDPDSGNTSGNAGASGGAASYASLAQLPNGLTVSNPDFTRQVSEGSYRLRVSGGSGTYTWVSENPAIATVDSNGTVTPIANGNVNILVSDGSKKAISIVRVKGGGSPSSGGSSSTSTSSGSSSSSNKLNKEDITISVGETAKLSVSGVTTSLTWSVSNSSIATVNGSGTVTGVSKGQTTVTVSWDGQSRSCIVRVK